MTLQQLYQVAQATSDGQGTIDLTFAQVPQGLTWTGSITAAVNPQSTALLTDATPARLIGATWTISVNGVPVLSYQGLEVVEDFQASGRQAVTIHGTGLTPNTHVLATWTGYSDYTQNISPLGPGVSGDPGSPMSDLSSGSGVFTIGSTGPLVWNTAANSTASSTVVVTPAATGTTLFAYLLAYTLGSSMGQLSTTTGTHGFDASLQVVTVSGTVPFDQQVLVTVPAQATATTVGQNFIAAPIPLGPATTVSVQLVNGPSSADIVRSWCSVLIAYM